MNELEDSELGLRNMLYMIMHTEYLTGETIRMIIKDVMKAIEVKESEARK